MICYHLNLPDIQFTNQSDIYRYHTRQAKDLHIAPTNTSLTKNTMKTQGPIIWNTLNKSIKNCSSFAILKNKLKKTYL